MINVFINGYGTVGKRVADAVALQKDMKIIGVSKRTPDFDAEQAIKKGYDLYCVDGVDIDTFKKRGLKTQKGISKFFAVVRSCLSSGMTPGGPLPVRIGKTWTHKGRGTPRWRSCRGASCFR